MNIPAVLPRWSVLYYCVLAAAATLTLTQCSDTTIVDSGLKSGAVNVTTYHYDNMRSGVQSKETALTPANVTSASFGKLFTLQVDGQVYAQPLIATNLQTADGKFHNVVFVATEHDTVYAFDADSPSTQPLWSTSLLGTGETTVPVGDVNSSDITPEIGITGTPVIDEQKGALYVVANTKATVNGQATYAQRLHALSLTEGKEILNGPTLINPTVAGTAPDAVNGKTPFSALRSLQRCALALINGNVWVAFSSHGDTIPYHGWLVGYNGADISSQSYVFDDTPNGLDGGIWMGASGPSSDSSGDIFLNSGNGDFDPRFANYSSTSFRLRPGSGTSNANGNVQIVDSFTAYNQSYLSTYDYDFGIMGSVILPDQSGPIPHLLITADKQSFVYVINRDSFGGYDPKVNHIVQTFSASPNHTKQNGLFFNNTLYISTDSSPMYAYAFDPATEQFQTTPASATPQVFTCINCYVGGSAPSISANGTSNAIVWTIDATAYKVPAPGVLHAYDAADLSHELYNSTQAPGNRDQASTPDKFSTPVVANGKVYVGGSGAVDVYGILGNFPK